MDPGGGKPVADAPGTVHFEVGWEVRGAVEGGEGAADEGDPGDVGPGCEGAGAGGFEDAVAFCTRACLSQCSSNRIRVDNFDRGPILSRKDRKGEFVPLRAAVGSWRPMMAKLVRMWEYVEFERLVF